MEILNFTGRPIGLTTESGQPLTLLSSNGFAKCQVQKIKQKTFNLIPIYYKSYGRVTGLPSPQPDLQKLYIVNKDVAEAAANTRFDLLVVEDPIEWGDKTFYKSLVEA